ncbi:chy zinc finger domain-containing protein [Stylonychia lemnae]|uniref:Chy zinc finger domain-containing protein n=1 Tax=Stylonychia lemnae TaxID=5949 RepID=A0A078BAT4_STYLE|nr:chy zinc finger domain-containing protein [Stylonychia lemnae]|eukprot:CDW91479.1 chy zinc finger domain-containing protein [Stylonychia lemnae]
MCKHILNAQVQVRAQCCKLWFDCPECHAESQDHDIERSMEIILACKKCRKVFRKDMNNDNDESDEYCPRCDNHYVIAAETAESKGKLVIEFEQERGHEHKMFKDDREKDRELNLM